MRNNNTLYAIYDLSISPLSFDFSAFLIGAELERLKFPDLNKVYIVVIPNEINENHLDKKLFDQDQLTWRLNNIIIPLCQLLPSCSGYTICNSRENAKTWVANFDDHIYPENFTVEVPIDRHHTGWSIIAAHQGKDVRFLEAPPQARAYARQWIDNQSDGGKCIALTLREAPFLPNRNSNIQIWDDLASKLKKAGYFPVILRDIDMALARSSEEFEKFPKFSEGVFNLLLRAAFYEETYMSAFVANGPAQICFYSKRVNFIYSITGEWLQKDPTPFGTMGIEFGETPPFANEFQRWIWKEQDADNLLSEIINLDRDIQRSQKDGTFELRSKPINSNRLPFSTLSKRFNKWSKRTYGISSQQIELAELCIDNLPLKQLTGKEQFQRLITFALGSRDLEKANNLLQSMGIKFGYSSEDYIQLGVVNEALKNFSDAAKFYELAIKLNGKSPELIFRLGIVYKSLGEFERSQKNFEFLISQGSTYADLYLELGTLFELMKDETSALNCYQIAETKGIITEEMMRRKSRLALKY